MVNEYTKDWIEFNFDENMPQYLREERQHIVELPPPDAKEQEQQAEILSEKATEHTLQTVEIYDYSEEDIDIFANQLIRAVQLLTIVARCLPNFEHSMPTADKEAFVKVIYSLPNKVFLETDTNHFAIKRQEQRSCSRRSCTRAPEIRI